MNAKNLLVGLMVSAMAMGVAVPALAAEGDKKLTSEAAALTASIVVNADSEVPEGTVYMDTMQATASTEAIVLDSAGELPEGAELIEATMTVASTAVQDEEASDAVALLEASIVPIEEGKTELPSMEQMIQKALAFAKNVAK